MTHVIWKFDLDFNDDGLATVSMPHNHSTIKIGMQSSGFGHGIKAWAYCATDSTPVEFKFKMVMTGQTALEEGEYAGYTESLESPDGLMLHIIELLT